MRKPVSRNIGKNIETVFKDKTLKGVTKEETS